MNKVVGKLTVLFEKPYWIGLFEVESEGKYNICKVTFGAEPKDYQVFEFILKNYNKLDFGKKINCFDVKAKKINPKKMQREIKKELKPEGMGTKAQEALKLQHELKKVERKKCSKKRREEEKEKMFLLKQQKRKQKRRGH